MKIDQQLRFIVIKKQADSLFSLIADGKYRNTSLGRETWKSLIGSDASLQLNCNKEGFNANCGGKISSKARIGIVGKKKKTTAQIALQGLDLALEGGLFSRFRAVTQQKEN